MMNDEICAGLCCCQLFRRKCAAIQHLHNLVVEDHKRCSKFTFCAQAHNKVNMGCGPKRGKLKGKSGANRSFKRSAMDGKTRPRDIDRIQDDILRVQAGGDMPDLVDEDLPGGGRHYCLPCARHFISNDVLRLHLASKVHKKRVKVVAEPQYTQREADAGAGVTR